MQLLAIYQNAINRTIIGRSLYQRNGARKARKTSVFLAHMRVPAGQTGSTPTHPIIALPLRLPPAAPRRRRQSSPAPWRTAGRGAICWSLIGVLAWTHVASSWADPFLDAARQGQDLGRGEADKYSTPARGADGNYSMPDAGVTLDMQDIFPEEGNTDIDSLQQIYGDENAMLDAGADAQNALATNASPTGEAYRTVRGLAGMQQPDLTSDPIWTQTDEVTGNIDLFAAGFSDCTLDSRFREGTLGAHVPQYEYCTRNRIPLPGDCEVEHEVAIADHSVEVKVGAYMKDQATFRVDLTTGAWATIAPTDANGGEEFVAEVPVLDYAEVCGGKVTTVEHLATYAWADAPVSGDLDPSTDYRVLQTPTCENGLVGIFQLDDQGSGEEWWKYAASFHLFYRKLEQDRWSPQQCVDAAIAAVEFCGDAVTRIGGRDDAGCADINGTRVCASDPIAQYISSPHAEIDPFLSGLTIAPLDFEQCRYWEGDMACWTDPQGETHCPTIDELHETSCGELEARPDCGFVSRECVEEGASSNGYCFVQAETWDCGQNVELPSLESEQVYHCAGPIRCMGQECVQPQKENSRDFARAVGALQAADYLRTDGSCDESGVCSVFAGEAMECKVAVGGLQDCCKTPSGIDLGSYINLALKINRLDSLIGIGPQDAALRGAWETLRFPFDSAWSAVKGGFSTAWDSLIGGSSATVTDAAKSGLIGATRQQMLDSVARWTGSTFGEAAGSQIFSWGGNPWGVGSASLGGGSAYLGTAMGAVMTAYTVYSITVILVQILWECEEEEFELGARRELKTCHYVGSYCANKKLGVCIEKRRSFCCFNSPLARIIQEQGRAQMGMDWGKAKSPFCQGFSPYQLSAINWDALDLSEWLGILEITGNWPGDSLDPALLTGQPSLAGDIGAHEPAGVRQDVIDRTWDRVEGLDTTGVREEAGGELRLAKDAGGTLPPGDGGDIWDSGPGNDYVWVPDGDLGDGLPPGDGDDGSLPPGDGGPVSCPTPSSSVNVVDTGSMANPFARQTYLVAPQVVTAFKMTVPPGFAKSGHFTATKTSAAERSKLVVVSECPGVLEPVGGQSSCVVYNLESSMIRMTADPALGSYHCKLTPGHTYYINAVSKTRLTDTAWTCSDTINCSFFAARGAPY